MPRPRSQRRVVAHWAPCRGRVTRCATHRVVDPRSRYKNCIATQIPIARVVELLRRIAGRWAPYSSTSPAVSRHKGRPSCHVTNHCIVTPPVARPHACTLPLAPRASRPCHGPLLAVSWSCRGALLVVPRLAMRSCALMCQDTIYYIVTQTEKWVVAHPVSLRINFFFSSFSTHYKITKYIYIYIYIYISHLPIEPKIFIIIYFIYFFPVLHIVKPQKRKKNFLNIIVPMCYSSSIQAHSHTSIIKMHN